MTGMLAHTLHVLQGRHSSWCGNHRAVCLHDTASQCRNRNQTSFNDVATQEVHECFLSDTIILVSVELEGP